MKKIFFLFCFFFSVASHAVEWNKATDFAWDIGTGKITTFPGQGSGNIWQSGELKANPLGPTLERQKALPFNPSPTANFKSTFTPKAIAKAVLSPTSAAINLALYFGINALLDSACTRVMGGSMSLAPGGQWEECKYRDEIAVEWSTATSPVFKGTTPDSAAAGWWSYATTKSTCSGSGTSLYCTWVEFIPTSCGMEYNQMTCKAVRHAKWTHATQGSGDTTSNAAVGLSSQSVTQKVKDGWQPSTQEKVAALVEPKLATMSQADFSNGYHGTSGQAGQVVDDIIQSGNGIEPDITVSGPASQPVSSSQTTDTVNNTTTTTTINNTYNYAKESPLKSVVTNTQNTTVVTVNNTTGAVTNNSNTTQTGKDVEVCGLPGKPACKMDETGTQTTFDPETYKPKVDALKVEQDTRRDTIAGKADKPFFQGWEIFFSAPSVVQCVPFVLPRDYGELNPCPVVDGVRLVMGYIWALAGLFLCIGMIKRSF